MSLRFTTLLLLFLGSIAPLTAQTKVQLSLPDAIGIGGTEIMCVPVVADSFPDIVSTSFSVRWDTAEVAFAELRLGDNPLQLDEMSIRTDDPDNFGVASLAPELMGITLEPGTILLEVCFLAKKTAGFTLLTWDGFFAPEFAQDGPPVAFAFDTIQGSLRYGATVATTVLPGDTNADGQVDHRDVLNIGLIHGAAGPARPTPSTNFTEQLAERWNLNLPNNLDRANADADGNGVIEDIDLSLVDNYYEQVAPDNTFTLAPDISDNGGPAFRIESPVTVDAGQPSELSIALGDGNNADAVGYAMAFALEFDPDQVAINDLTLDLANAFLGDDLLTLNKVSTVSSGRIEVALSRKDQTNTTTPGGEVVRISYTPLARSDNDSYPFSLRVIPNAFLRSDGSSAPIQGATAEITVTGTVATREPTWAEDLQLVPNPYTAGPLSLRGQLPRITGIRVLGLSGRCLQTYSGNVRQLDLAGLPAGVYLVKINTVDGQVTRKVVRQ